MTSYDRRIKVRITQPGMQTYNGYIRGTRFVNGESFEPMPIMDALRLGASCSVSDMDGKVISPNYVVHEDANTVNAADVTPPRSKTKEENDANPAPEVVGEEAEDDIVGFYEPEDEIDAPKQWTREGLEALADAEGIQGLRDIGDSYGVKERSIDGLIVAIVKAQSETDKLAGEE